MDLLIEISKLLQKEPKLKGREIAKKLGIDKKEVNSFLSNEDTFNQDSSYRWTVANFDVLEVVFPSKWISSEIFEDILIEYEFGVNTEVDSVVFVFPSKECKMLMDSIARFLALCNQLIEKGVNVTIDFSECKNSLHYFNRSGFLDNLDINVKTVPDRPAESTAEIYKGNSESVLEIGCVQLDDSNTGLINRLTDKFINLASEKFEFAASTTFSEMIGNIVDHSESSCFAFAGLQSYKWPRKHIQTVISDSGIGIIDTLRPSLKIFYPKLYKKYGEKSFENDFALLKVMIEKGGVSRYGSEDGRGCGFGRSGDYAKKFNANLTVRQQEFELKLIYEEGKLKKTRKRKNLQRIEGTHVCFDFFVD